MSYSWYSYEIFSESVETNTALTVTFFFQLGERKSLTAEVEIVDESSATQLQYTSDAGNSFAISYMQSVTPSITLGGTSYRRKAITWLLHVCITIYNSIIRGWPVFYEEKSPSDWFWRYLWQRREFIRCSLGYGQQCKAIIYFSSTKNEMHLLYNDYFFVEIDRIMRHLQINMAIMEPSLRYLLNSSIYEKIHFILLSLVPVAVLKARKFE